MSGFSVARQGEDQDVKFESRIFTRARVESFLLGFIE
jgi:hypothetical protein